MSKLFLPALLAATSSLVLPLSAQTGAAAGPEPAPLAALKANNDPVNLLTTLETWSLSRSDFLALLDTPSGDGAGLARLEELAQSGRAKLLELMAVSAKSGHLAMVESIDEVRSATEFDPATAKGEIDYPQAWETRSAGGSLELEAALGPDGRTIDLRLVPVTTRFEGFQDLVAEAGGNGVAQPQFRTQKLSTDITVHSGYPVLLGTSTPSNAESATNGGQVQIRVLRVTAQSVPPPVANATPSAVPAHAQAEFSLYSMDRADARRILNAAPDSSASFAAVRELLVKGQARLETLCTFAIKSGVNANYEAIREVRHATELSPPAYRAKANRQPASVNAFETRHTGVKVGIEPKIGPRGEVALRVLPRIIEFHGMLEATGVAAKYPPQPLFSTRDIHTHVSGTLGVPMLLGTFNRAASGANQREDDGRTWLAYIRVSSQRP